MRDKNNVPVCYWTLLYGFILTIQSVFLTSARNRKDDVLRIQTGYHFKYHLKLDQTDFQ